MRWLLGYSGLNNEFVQDQAEDFKDNGVNQPALF